MKIPRTQKASRLAIWDMLSIFTLILTVCIVAYFVAIYMMPNSAINPLNPNRNDYLLPPTPTITQIQLLPTWTNTPINVTETPTLLANVHAGTHCHPCYR
jgi:hypothetical protein